MTPGAPSRTGAILRAKALRGWSRLPLEPRRRWERRLGPLGVWLGSGPVRVWIHGASAAVLLARLSPGHLQAAAIVRGALELQVQMALARLLRPGDAFWDVGANLGFHTLLAAQLVGPTGRVAALEPVPDSAAAIRGSVALNGFGDRVIVHEVAAGERGGPAEFLEVSEAGWSHLADRGLHPQTARRRTVEVVRLDELVRAGRAPAPALVKVDVEGSERAVLAGMRDVLRRHRPAVIVELHETGAEVARLLAEAGYGLERLDAPGPVPDRGHVLALARPAPPRS